MRETQPWECHGNYPARTVAQYDSSEVSHFGRMNIVVALLYWASIALVYAGFLFGGIALALPTTVSDNEPVATLPRTLSIAAFALAWIASLAYRNLGSEGYHTGDLPAVIGAVVVGVIAFFVTSRQGRN